MDNQRPIDPRSNNNNSASSSGYPPQKNTHEHSRYPPPPPTHTQYNNTQQVPQDTTTTNSNTTQPRFAKPPSFPPPPTNRPPPPSSQSYSQSQYSQSQNNYQSSNNKYNGSASSRNGGGGYNGGGSGEYTTSLKDRNRAPPPSYSTAQNNGRESNYSTSTNSRSDGGRRESMPPPSRPTQRSRWGAPRESTSYSSSSSRDYNGGAREGGVSRDQQQQVVAERVGSVGRGRGVSNKPAWMSSSSSQLESRPETASSSGAYPSQSVSSSGRYQSTAPVAPVSTSTSQAYPTAYPDGHPSTQVGSSGQYPPQSSTSSGSMSYPEQQHSSSSYPSQDYHPASVKSEQGSTFQYPPPVQQSSGIKSEVDVKSEVKEELVDTDNEEEETEQPKVDDATYTASLNWATANAKNPNICQIIEKRPIDLPNDVEHIQDVEWADSGPSETHNRAGGGSSSNLSNMGGVFQSANSAISKLERAPRPKPIRPEACFCEPNLTTQTMCCTDTSCALFACQEECGNNCPAGPLCGNKRITKKEWKPLSVFDAGLKGRGLMVQQSCQPGDFIVEYVGVAVKKQYLDGLFSRYKHERMLYIMALDGNVYIDARHRGGIARYINHSCEPNCVVHRWKVKGISRAGVFALKEIKEGEELSFDYQWERKRGRSLTKCHCGSINCRGTIESSKTSNDDDDDEEEEFELEGEWMEQREGQLPGKNIMNRTVKVYEPDDDLWNVADVAQYDNTNGNKHLLMYHGQDAVEEHWVDLSTRKWMILVEPQKEGALEGIGDGQGSYAITRKNEYGGSRNSSSQSLLINAPQGALGSNANTPRSDGAQSPIPGKGRSYLYIQTPVKDIMVARHTLFKCSQYSRVHIDTDKLTVPHNWGLGKNTLSFGEGKDVSDEEEAELLSKAYDNSKDGVVWKLSVTGKEVAKAVEWLEKILGRINADLGIAAPDATSGLTPAINGSMASLASAGGIAEPEDNRHRTEVIIPRIIVAETKTRFFSLKGYCYNCEVKLTHSDSKSKQFAKFTILSETESDLEKAREYLSGELDSMCRSHNAPMTKLGVYKTWAGWEGIVQYSIIDICL